MAGRGADHRASLPESGLEPASALRQDHHHFDEHSDDDDDCCRICRGSAPPLFYPCKCSGSIKYVHQQCLLDWLGHSGNTHCEVCKHEFVFTPVYAKDAPTRLPWPELAAGLVKRAVTGVKVAHRVWVVACVWLIAVPWITCLAWRLAFLRGFDEVPRLLRERCNVLAIATDCIQGSLLSIGVVFVNMTISSLKQHLKTVVARLENQLLRDIPARGARAAAAQTGAVAADAAAAVQAAMPVAAAPRVGTANEAGTGAMDGNLTADGVQLGAAATSSASVDIGGSSSSNTLRAAPADGATSGSSAESEASSSSMIAAAPASPSYLTNTSAVFAPHAGTNAAVASSSNQHEATLQQHEPQQEERQQQPGQVPEAMAAAAAAAAGGADDAMLAAAAAVGAVADPGGGGELGVGEGPDVWGDVPIEELLGLQGPWVDFLEMVVLLLAGNASFMAGCVYLPLNIGRLILTALRKAGSLMTQEQQQLLLAMIGQHIQLPFITELLALLVGLLSPHVPATATDAGSSTAAAAAGANATASAAAAGSGSLLYQAADASEPVPLVSLNLDQFLKELQAQMELPARADVVALSIGHALLAMVLLLGVWLYVSVRLWRAARRRARLAGRRPLLQVMGSTGRWLLSAATMCCQGAKLMLLLVLELGVFPVAAGLWLDLCVLPLTATSLGQRQELIFKAPMLSAFMHWVIGVGFVLALTFLMCVLREVLRPGALPFIKDPTNTERNPVREMLEEPLLNHLGRTTMSWLVYAGLCVMLVHIPALLAKAMVPSLYPLRVALFDPLTQIPADMLLLHIFIPFAVEHVRVKGAVKGAVQTWLRLVARLLDWSDYLLPPEERNQVVVAALPAPAAADMQQPIAVAAPEAEAGFTAALDGTGGSSSSSGLQADPDHQPDSQHQEAAPVQQHNEQYQHQQGSSNSANMNRDEQQPLLDQAATFQSQQGEQQQHQLQGGLQHRPVKWYEQQDNYGLKLLGLFVSWLASAILLHTLLLIVPIGLGRALFIALHLPFKNDLFTGAIGLLVLWGVYTFAAAVASSASMMNLRAVAAAAWRWSILVGQCAVLLVLWLGVVATMLGMLCELVLLPLRLPPNQTALIYLYQDWTMGVLALKLWHLLVMVSPRREGRLPPDPDSWQAHFDALQAGGLRNLDLNRALTKIVLPVMLHLATCLALPYVVTRGLLPLLGLPAVFLQYANLYGHQVFHGVYLATLGSKKLAALAVQLHNTIRDDRYLVGRELHNFELQRQEAKAAQALQAASEQLSDEAVGSSSTLVGDSAASNVVTAATTAG